MGSLNLLPFLVAGLAGSVHCAGMCGGIVSAFSVAPARAFPVAVVTRSASPALARALAYNAGRIASYAAAGAMAGGAANGARAIAGVAPLQAGGYWAANLLLVAMGLYLMGALPLLAQVERAGQGLWRRIQPGTALLLPADTPLKLGALGALWGWLPCGMVYSMLMTAMLTGSASGGATVMLAFGIGTLPMLLALGAAGASLQRVMRARAWRTAAGTLVALFGLLGLWRAYSGAAPAWIEMLCLAGGVP